MAAAEVGRQETGEWVGPGSRKRKGSGEKMRGPALMNNSLPNLEQLVMYCFLAICEPNQDYYYYR